MKPVYLAIVIFVFFMNCRKNLTTITAVQVKSPTTDQLYNGCFVNDTFGVIVGGDFFKHGTILETRDGGNTWSIANLPFETQTILNVTTRNDTAVIATGLDSKMYNLNGLNTNWTFFQNQTWCELTAIKYINEDYGIAVGTRDSKGKVLTLNHFGEFFTSDNVKDPLKDFCTTDGQFIVACGQAQILYSQNGGHYWNATNADGDIFIKLTQNTNNQYYAYGLFGKIATSIDGKHWTTIRKQNNLAQSDFHFRNAMFLSSQNLHIAVGDHGLVLLSYDSWKTWTVTKPFTKNIILSIFKSPKNDVFVGTNKGEIFKLTL